ALEHVDEIRAADGEHGVARRARHVDGDVDHGPAARAGDGDPVARQRVGGGALDGEGEGEGRPRWGQAELARGEGEVDGGEEGLALDDHRGLQGCRAAPAVGRGFHSCI
ncbi:MAG: hypothetical protein ACK559_19670, partial [bacterium]